MNVKNDLLVGAVASSQKESFHVLEQRRYLGVLSDEINDGFESMA